MIIDFHTHSHASDGALAPRELLEQAVAAGVTEFALTDHDTVAGYRSLLAEGYEAPPEFRLVPGTELSCVWDNVSIHVVGLGMDIDHPQFVAGLEILDQARRDRAEIIAERMEKAGMPGALEGARAEAGVSQIGRPHFAAWMVAQGHAKDLNRAFDRFLGAGKRGDVKTCWPSLAQAVDWITAAGGLPILAHALKYKITRTKLRACLVDFKAAGGQGMEVYSGRQTAEQTRDLCKLAAEFDLVASGGSDFHAEWDYGPSLGFDLSLLPAGVDFVSAERLSG